MGYFLQLGKGVTHVLQNVFFEKLSVTPNFNVVQKQITRELFTCVNITAHIGPGLIVEQDLGKRVLRRTVSGVFNLVNRQFIVGVNVTKPDVVVVSVGDFVQFPGNDTGSVLKFRIGTVSIFTDKA
ncbi:MAG TPA: hypothetical protein PLV99_12000 [Prolixibacteraceae bacterium]|nr:hypothetical protein [Prolixibacteraceae bacterium]